MFREVEKEEEEEERKQREEGKETKHRLRSEQRNYIYSRDIVAIFILVCLDPVNGSNPRIRGKVSKRGFHSPRVDTRRLGRRGDSKVGWRSGGGFMRFRSEAPSCSTCRSANRRRPPIPTARAARQSRPAPSMRGARATGGIGASVLIRSCIKSHSYYLR